MPKIRFIDDSPAETFVKKNLPFEAMLVKKLEEKKLSTKQPEVTVEMAPGLFLKGNTKSNSWVYRFKNPLTNKPTCKTVGKADDTSLAEAMARAAILRDALKAGRSPIESMITVGDYFDQHYYPAALKTKRSAPDDLSRFNCHIRAVAGQIPLSMVRPHHLMNLIEQLPAHLAIATKNHVTVVIKSIFKQAVERGLMENSPATRLKVRRTLNARQRVLDTAEIRAVIAPVESEANPLPRYLNRFLLATAVRLSEALTAKFSDVDMTTRFLHLRTTKNGKPRAVPLSEEALAVINELSAIRRNEYLFPGRFGGHMTRPSSALKRMQADAGVSGFCYHDFRRTGCSIVINAGIPLLDASRLLGHSNTAVTQAHYAVLHADRLHAAAAQISNVLRAAAGTTTK